MGLDVELWLLVLTPWQCACVSVLCVAALEQPMKRRGGFWLMLLVVPGLASGGDPLAGRVPRWHRASHGKDRRDREHVCLSMGLSLDSKSTTNQ